MATEQCIAFTSEGEFKNIVLPSQQWQDSEQDLYIAGQSARNPLLHYVL